DQEPVAYIRLPTPGGAYTLSYLPGRYYVSAFVDFNGSSGPPDTNELLTYYDGNGDGLPDLVDVLTQTATLDFALGQIIYVDASASGDNNGTSWADAYPDLSSALAVAPANAEIWLAEGTYTPGTNREDSFTLKNNVAIYGGFAGDEQWRQERNFAQNAAILSGDIGTAGVKTDNSYHVVTSSETDHTAVLDGVIISGGYANSEGFHDKGGGILNINGSPTLANLRLLDNYAMNHGAGMVNVGTEATPTLINCEFSGNRTTFNGALANLNDANPTLINATLTGNLGGNSGGVANISSHATLINTVLWGNQGPEISLQLGATISVSHSIVAGGYAGVGNLSGDPLFVDADGADGVFGTLDDDLHLQAGSPAIDAGDNTAVPPDSGDSDGDADVLEPFPFDRDQQARHINDPDTPDSGHGTAPLVDIGADEFVLTEPSGLSVLNNSPTLLGTATSFTATVQSGNSLVYAWAFGDGQVGSGAQVSHTYALPGLYTAVVTVSNSLG
ncbi:MAG: PKD domain-containing protein, partial [Anaerolineales bacterium]|nr:PKD domain-containing protein [Anaerolineales bacterium]